jgi:hypothetical protein
VLLTDYKFYAAKHSNEQCIYRFIILDFNFIRNRVEKFYELSNCEKKADRSKKFIFQKLYMNERKLFLLSKNDIVLCGDFNESVNSFYIKLFLLHMYISFTNFNETLIDRIQTSEPMDQDLYETPSDNDKPKTISSKNSEYLQLKIYETFFIQPISTHFENVFKLLIKKEEISLSYIKFKNMYVVDLSNQDVLFDLNSFKVKRK